MCRSAEPTRTARKGFLNRRHGASLNVRRSTADPPPHLPERPALQMRCIISHPLASEEFPTIVDCPWIAKEKRDGFLPSRSCFACSLPAVQLPAGAAGPAVLTEHIPHGPVLIAALLAGPDCYSHQSKHKNHLGDFCPCFCGGELFYGRRLGDDRRQRS